MSNMFLQHGTPQQIIDVGETHIDAETFQEYLSSVSELYTPSAYHLMDFNCNNFTADVVGFLTGAEIPSWISGVFLLRLPSPTSLLTTRSPLRVPRHTTGPDAQAPD